MEPSHIQTFALTLEKIEGSLAVLKNEEFGEFHLPAKYLPEGLEKGEKVILKTDTEKMNNEDKYKKMRNLLEELIN